MRLTPSLIALAASTLLATACATTTHNDDSGHDMAGHQEVFNPRFAAIGHADAPLERDRRAILAMQGEYEVDFHFEETVRLAPGYEYHHEKNTGAHEAVFAIAEQPDFISLQHILVVGDDFVVKHWRQDWFLDADNRFEFSADQTWTVNEVPDDAGRWTQCVYEVSDAPRYCGTGNWNHKYGVSTWTSDRTWRPLPRREYTVREDYNAMNGENRHTITPFGWSHEQDNTKVVRDGEATESILVREFGFNDYKNVEGIDFSPAYDYWEDTSGYWADVRAEWSQRLQPGNQLVLLTGVDGMEIIEATFAWADTLRDGYQPPEPSEGDSETIPPSGDIEALLDRYSRVTRADQVADVTQQ